MIFGRKMIEKDDILRLIPQRPPFVLVDSMLSCDEKDTVTQFTVSQDCPLQHEGLLQPWGLIENIAQSCAARIGYLATQGGEEVAIGVIGSVNDMEISRLPQVGETITTKITILEEVMNLTLVSSEITSASHQEKCLATAKMKIALLISD